MTVPCTERKRAFGAGVLPAKLVENVWSWAWLPGKMSPEAAGKVTGLLWKGRNGTPDTSYLIYLWHLQQSQSSDCAQNRQSRHGSLSYPLAVSGVSSYCKWNYSSHLLPSAVHIVSYLLPSKEAIYLNFTSNWWRKWHWHWQYWYSFCLGDVSFNIRKFLPLSLWT